MSDNNIKKRFMEEIEPCHYCNKIPRLRESFNNTYMWRCDCCNKVWVNSGSYMDEYNKLILEYNKL